MTHADPVNEPLRWKVSAHEAEGFATHCLAQPLLVPPVERAEGLRRTRAFPPFRARAVAAR